MQYNIPWAIDKTTLFVAWHDYAKWRHHEDTGKKKEEKGVDIAKRKKGF
jgi:hypothetical protein